MGDEGEYVEVFGLARVAPETEKISKPETEEDWLRITSKIDKGQIDSDVVLATLSDAWPEKYDKNEIWRVYSTRILRNQEYNNNEITSHAREQGKTNDTLDILSKLTNEGNLPSGKQLNAIWLQMLEEIERQRNADKKPKD